MAWIEFHDDVWEHHKTERLADLLGLPVVYTVGHLGSLWHFVLRNAWRTASLEPWGDRGVERAARWIGEPGKFVAAAREVGILDGFIVHGWSERAGRLVYDRFRKEEGRHPTLAERTTADNLRKIGGQSKATLPNSTVPNSTVPTDRVPRVQHKAFDIPTPGEVKAYCLERSNGLDAEKFVAYYEARGWMLGKKQMVSWKAAVRTWERSGYNATAQGKGVKPEPGKYASVGRSVDCDAR